MPAGFLRWEAMSLVGPLSEGLFEKVNIQTAFVGAAGFSIDAGLSDATEEEAQIKRLMVAAATEVVAVVDHTKWQRAAFATFCPTGRISAVVSDSAPRPAWPPSCDSGASGFSWWNLRQGRSADRVDRECQPGACPNERTRGPFEQPGQTGGHAGRRCCITSPSASVRRRPSPMCRSSCLPEKSMPSSARTARARARWSRSLPASTNRTAASSTSRAKPAAVHDPVAARALGIAVVHQEPSLFPDLSVGRERLSRRLRHGLAGPDRLEGRAPARRPGSSNSWTSGSIPPRRSAACRWPISSSSRSPRRSRSTRGS